MLCPHQRGDLISCHGSLKGGDGSECLCLIAVSVGTCDPLCLYGEGEILPHGLGCVVSLATCPHDAAGAEVGRHGKDHRSVV